MRRRITIYALMLVLSAGHALADCSDLYETVAAPLTQAPSTAKRSDTRKPLNAKAPVSLKEPDTAPPLQGPNGTEIHQTKPSPKKSTPPAVPKRNPEQPYNNAELQLELSDRGYEFIPTGTGFNIGRGGMGAVFLSSRINPESGQQELIALKTATTDRNAFGLYQEARTLQTLNAAEAGEQVRYFPVVYNAGQVKRIQSLNNNTNFIQNGLWRPINPAIEMEFVPRNSQFPTRRAYTLQDVISNHVDYRDDPQKPPLTETFIWHLEEAMKRAHAQGLVHLDLKPDNIGIRENGIPVIFDHGLASNYEQGSGSSGGTFGWMGEAQFTHQPSRPKDDVDNIVKLHAALKIAQNPGLRTDFTYRRPASDRTAVKHALETPEMSEGQRLIEMADWSRLARTVEERRAFRIAAQEVASSQGTSKYKAKKERFLKQYGQRLGDRKNFDTDVARYSQLIAKELLGSKTAIDHIYPKSGLQLSRKTIRLAIVGAQSILAKGMKNFETKSGWKKLRSALLNDEIFSPYLHFEHFADHVSRLHVQGHLQLSERDLASLQSIKSYAARVREVLEWTPPSKDPGVIVLRTTSD